MLKHRVWILLIGMSIMGMAHADDDDEHGGRDRRGAAALTTAPGYALYREECGSCHIPYPPGMLPARAWTALLDGLDKHFGENAELPAESAQTLAAFLTRHAGRDRGESSLRITETRQFRAEHREAPATRATSMSDCAACHPRATDGSFNERDIRLPGGAARRD